MKKKLYICDFDGTVTLQDVTDTLMIASGGNKWMNAGKLYDDKKIWHKTMNRHFARLLKLGPTEVGTYVKSNIKIRPGFNEFAEKCKKNSIPLIIASSGWDIYIRTLLHKLDPYFVDTIDEYEPEDLGYRPAVIANRIAYDTDAQRWELHFPFPKYQCRISSPCKGMIARRYIGKGFKVYAIGNSYSDICMAKNANRIFTTGSLTDICRKLHLSYTPFTDFFQIPAI